MSEDVFNAGQRDEAVKTLSAKIEQDAKQRRINFSLTFSTMEGFEVLRDIALMTHMDEISFDPMSARNSDFREGERNVFLYILSNLNDELRAKIIIGG
jgi:hypothetical protein